MPHLRERRAAADAVVLGAGIGGLLAAAALRHAGLTVLVLERDRLPQAPRLRPGVPHARQLHNLLGRGQLHIEELLPGFHSRLHDAGAVAAEVSSQTHVYELGVMMPERPLGLHIWSALAPVIEHTVRDLAAGAGVTVQDCTRVLQLRVSDAHQVTGVQVSQDGHVYDIEADVVVDAMGAMSPAATWLARLGCQPPAVEAHQTRQWYCSLITERPPSCRKKPDYWLVFPTFPNGRGGLVSPVGDDKWCISLSGVAPDRAPRNAEEFTAFAGLLEISLISDLLREARPLGRPHLFGKPVATWRRYDRSPEPVAGFLPVGDAVASLSPLVGQGISVAAWQSAHLARVLGSSRDLAETTVAYLTHAATATASAWALLTLFDPPPGSHTPRLDREHWNTVAQTVAADADAHGRYVRMWHLLEPVSVLDEILEHPKMLT
jgi:flavin-dependent dehydrogenase